MKIAISGKGGVGKTTLSALLSREIATRGEKVYAVDADPNPTLAYALGISRNPTPLVELKEMITDRMGGAEGFFRLNPRVEDIPEKFSVEHEGIRLLVMGGIRGGGTGCACPENAFLKALLQHVFLERNEWMVVDCEAGLEHLGRATARGVNCLLVVVEPDIAAIRTALRIRELAQDLKIGKVRVVANKVRGEEDIKYLESQLDSMPILASVPENPDIRTARRSGTVFPLPLPGLVAALQNLS